jgi:drug/metabolite transporter (DMT)-like permease
MNKGIYFAAFAALLWGFLAIAVKVSLSILPPISISWIRFAIAFSILSAYYLIFDRKKFSIISKPPLFALFAGIALGFNYLGFIAGINYTSPSIGQVFIQTGPVLFAIAGFVIYKERISIRQGIGFVIVLIGLMIFYNEQIINIAGGLSQQKKGVLLILFGALSWSFYAVFQKMAVRNNNPMQLNLIIFGLPALLYTPFVEFSSVYAMSFNQWMLMLFLGLNTLGAYGSLAYALKYLEANKISVIVAVNPLITFVAMAILSKKQVSWMKPENLTLVTILGALIALMGVVLTVVRKKSLK